MSITTMLPSRMSHERQQRRRTIRKVLAHHLRDGERCACGWRVPPFLMDGGSAFSDHLAERIEAAL